MEKSLTSLATRRQKVLVANITMNLELITRFQTTRKKCLHDAEHQYQDELEAPIEIDSTGTPIQQFQQRMLKEYLDNAKQHTTSLYNNNIDTSIRGDLQGKSQINNKHSS
ncbi:unnamed protein product [Ambrosiozyma monospora]|uniref:Unnamed protein product n=1 Tax=Ambrosiozyma monospora TaxID=43982 RepID=A0A9W6YYB0_AMBMO|nr:unnamed protein product [Ambrosiozyma monospora]